MPAPTRAFVPLLLLCFLSSEAAADEKPKASAARLAADAVIAGLPPPSPAVHFDYEGDLVVGGLWAGEVRYTARGAKVGRQAVWRVTRDTYLDHAGAETRIRLLLHLRPDLSILSGTYERKEKERTLSAAFSRTTKGLLVQRSRVAGSSEAQSEVADVGLASDATASIGALLLFLRAAPDKKGTSYAVPWLAQAALHSEPLELEGPAMTLTAKGRHAWGEGDKARKSWVVEARQGKSVFTLHLTPDRQALIGIRVQGGAGDIVPRGEGGERLTVKPDEPAATWKEAFLQFGFGYHLPRASLLAAAFHWDAMYEHETKVLKRWDAQRPVEDFKKAWIAEFVKQSKNRSIHDARRLLSMTLATGKIKKQTKDEIVFAAHKNFGGGVQRTYYLRCKDGVWGITRIDF